MLNEFTESLFLTLFMQSPLASNVVKNTSPKTDPAIYKCDDSSDSCGLGTGFVGRKLGGEKENLEFQIF